MTVLGFPSQSDWESWLDANHATSDGIWLKIAKKASGIPTVTHPEALDVALCYGWIDGQRNKLDDQWFLQRFTPRRPRSVWSTANVRRVEELDAAGRMRPAGRAAFERRSDARSGIYSYEQRDAATFDEDAERRFRADAEAWHFFESQPPWYRRAATHWVVSAKRPETRERRLAKLIADSASGRTVPPLTRPSGR